MQDRTWQCTVLAPFSPLAIFEVLGMLLDGRRLFALERGSLLELGLECTEGNSRHRHGHAQLHSTCLDSIHLATALDGSRC